ncbi:aminoacyl-tRNA hydrolase [Puniceicoccales bacterium CK1056]|uniref:Aminoacyl-tRNA hydrolase n=1 Tax=Oceanipulchritudo coccoides TaxID=2706888 RepID=A0A6B2M3Q3_9BACT|nr:alternative ribosome rescue aminoacyl-tRNA hydrolase ArfB [Oceanipulchritudo coccoides]NDV63598.1 aminoacyl-tRNA hydrolase [Oceanipulchritudo coccoides]
MLRLSERVTIPDEEILMQAVRAQGAGGQNVNKVSSAIHLFFNIHASSLPDFYKRRLFAHAAHRISEGGVIVIKAQEFRTQAKNREAALERLKEIILAAAAPRKTRKPTRPTRGSKERRITNKKQLSEKKQRRGKPDYP